MSLETPEAPSEVLLHSCCAPCSAAILEWMLDHGIKPTIFFYNPNIFPQKEYLIRKREIDRYAEKLGVRIIDGDYCHELWRISVLGLENEPERGKRCLACFSHRLLVTAECARKECITHYTTTLAGSRWKSLEQIRPRLSAPIVSSPACATGMSTGKKAVFRKGVRFF